jgi:hypothetical protein
VKRQPIRLLLIFAALALVASGCGSKSSSSSGTGLDTALSYVPKDAAVVVAVDTKTGDAQYKQLDQLIGKFPGGGQVKQAFKSGFNRSSHLDYDTDFKPLLGHDLVVASTASGGVGASGTQSYLFAWKVKDEGVARRLIQAHSRKVATAEGADIYMGAGGRFTAIKDGTLVGAATQADLTAALKRAGTGDHMTVSDFNSALGNLKHDALVRVAGNIQPLIAGPMGAVARKIKWVAALRSYGATLSADPDGISWAFHLTTDGGLQPSDLPLADGAQSAPVVRRAGEIGIGLRDPAQIVTFAQAASQITNPAGYAKYAGQKAKLSKQLGVDVDRDVIGQLTGNAEISIALNGGFAVRADLRDPTAAQATLKKAAPQLAKLAGGKAGGLTKPANGQGLYALAEPSGKKIAFGVVGKSFVAASDAARAAQFAGESPSIVQGAKGSVVLASDARALVNAIAAQRGQGVAAQIVTGALGDLIGSVDTEPTGLTGELKLHIR